ncbi:MAG: hypothetical protein K2W94_03645 [Alphaproteobacteria bacterium]|nr:hypothetical protein [Alphaproteobacteria bacterium]
MAYRLLQATERDIHSWNSSIVGSIVANSSYSEFVEIIQRIIARHFNLRVLQAMSDNIQKAISPAKASLHHGTMVSRHIPKVEEVVVGTQAPVIPTFPVHPTRYATELTRGWAYDPSTGEYKDSWGNVQDRESAL